MSKLVITRWENKILTALLVNGKCRMLQLEQEEEKRLLGNIYVGKVKNVVKNIGAAFIDLGNGQMGFYSLTENTNHIFADANHKIQNRQVKPGDELIVQVAKDAVKTKDPVLSCYLNFTGKYSVLTLGKTQFGFSAKIKDALWKEMIRTYLLPLKDDSFGIIVRTNAKEVSKEEIGEEILFLKERMQNLLSTAGCRTCYSVLFGSEPSYILNLRDLYSKDLDSIVTDDKTCFDEMSHYLRENQQEDLKKLEFYEDEMLSLLKLYSLETAMEEATNRHVWLKSGGYLVIEPTEALTVIDVNTGKYSGKKNIEDTILKINLEAAVESARQIQLRNLSGIIIIDFIDMSLIEHKEELLTRLEKELSKDSIKTVLVEMTKLGLVEITRKKIYKPLYEVLKYGKIN
ncbi:MAG: ribonuclease E/G [Clostridium sp.]